MTNQILTASLLSDAADIVDQTCKAMLEKAKANILSNPLEYYRWQSAVENGRMFRAQLQVLSEKFAEQERAQAEPRADISNCKTIADVSEAVNAFATQQIQQMATPVYTEPALRVGDKVRFTKSESPIRVWYEDGEIVSIVGDEFLCEGVRVIECKNNTTCQTVPLANLTLIERAQQ